MWCADKFKAFARKIIRELGSITKEDVDNEVRALKKLCQNQHPNIVKVFDYGQLNPDSVVHFIDMELCDVSLENYLMGQEFPLLLGWKIVRDRDEIPAYAYAILQQILNGLLYIHSLHEVHRDVSPHNGIHILVLFSEADLQYYSKTNIGKSRISVSRLKGHRVDWSPPASLEASRVIDHQNYY
jgi:hypothetical protein